MTIAMRPAAFTVALGATFIACGSDFTTDPDGSATDGGAFTRRGS